MPRHLGDLAIVLARLAPLLGRERRPVVHALLHPFLLLRLHLRVALGDSHPLLPPRCVERVPLTGQRREDLLVCRG